MSKRPLLSQTKISYDYVIQTLEELDVSSCCCFFSAPTRIKELHRKMNAGVLKSNFNDTSALAPKALYEYCRSCGITDGWQTENAGYGSVSSGLELYIVNSTDSDETKLIKQIANHGAILKSQQVQHSAVMDVRPRLNSTSSASSGNEWEASVANVAEQLKFLSKQEEKTRETIAQRFTVTELRLLKSQLKDIRKTVGQKKTVAPEGKKALVALAHHAIYLLNGLVEDFLALGKLSAKSKKRAMPYIYPKHQVSGGKTEESRLLCSQFGAFGAGADIGLQLRKFTLPPEIDEATSQALEKAKAKFVEAMNLILEKAVSTAQKQTSSEHSMKMYALHCVLKKFGDAEEASTVYDEPAQQRDIYRAFFNESGQLTENCAMLYTSMKKAFDKDYTLFKAATKRKLAEEAPQGIALNSGSASDSR